MLRLRTCAGGGVAPAKREAAINVPVDFNKKTTIINIYGSKKREMFVLYFLICVL